MKHLLSFLLVAIGMIAPVTVFGQCLTQTRGDNVVPYSYELHVEFPTMAYEQSPEHTRSVATGLKSPYMGWSDEPEHHYYLGSVLADTSITQGCTGIDTFWNPNSHPQPGCAWPDVVIRTKEHETWGNFTALFTWRDIHTYNLFVNGSLIPATATMSLKYVAVFIDGPTSIRIQDFNTGCETWFVLYPHVSVWIEDDAIQCDSVQLTAHTSANDPGPLVYTWSNGSVTQSITVPQNGWYEVTVTNANGLSGNEWINPYYSSSVGFAAWLEDGYCMAVTEIWRGNPPYTFEWNGSDGTSFNDSLIPVRSNTTYWVTVTDGCGNQDYDRVDVPDISTTDITTSLIGSTTRTGTTRYRIEERPTDTIPNTMVIYLRDSIVTHDSTYHAVGTIDSMAVTRDCQMVTGMDTFYSGHIDTTWRYLFDLHYPTTRIECLPDTIHRPTAFINRVPTDSTVWKELTEIRRDTVGSYIVVDTVTSFVTEQCFIEFTGTAWVVDRFSCGLYQMTDTIRKDQTGISGCEWDTVTLPPFATVYEIETGINDPEFGRAIKMYPNPASTETTVTCYEPGAWTLRLFTTDGKNLLSKRMERERFVRLNCTTIATGTYIVLIESDSGKSTSKKLLVER